MAGRPSVARSGAFSLFGAMTSAAMGFTLVVVLGRTLGTAGSGEVLQGVAAFSITLGVARFGLDTTAVWLLPRLADDEPARVRPAVLWLLVPGLVLGCLAGAGLYLFGLAAHEPVGEVFRAMSWFMPAAAVMTVGLAATRGLGGVRPYVVVNSIGVPSARPLLVGLTAALGLGAVAAATAWSSTFLVGAVAALVVAGRRVRRLERRRNVRAERWWPQTELRRQMLRYSLPRSVAVVLEQLILWVDVLLVGLLAGPTAAGIYGAATRFVAAGRIVSTALRIVVAPLYSRMLGRGETARVQELYTTTTTWIVLLGTPLYALYATVGGTLLSALGTGFREGAPALAILSGGLVLTLLGGNLQSLLLMSGMSGRVAVYKTVALAFLVGGMTLLVPLWGLEGAALAWSSSVTVDTVLSGLAVTRRLGVRIGGRPVVLALLVGGVLPAAAAGAVRVAMGDTVAALLVALPVALVLFLSTSWLLRDRLHLAEILQLLRRRPGAV